ncbi:CsbD family protein [Corynebacterium sp. S7]
MADLQNEFDKVSGKAKEAYGEAAGDKSVENEGKADQTKADFKDKLNEAGDAVKDKANEVLGKFQDNKDN